MYLCVFRYICNARTSRPESPNERSRAGAETVGDEMLGVDVLDEAAGVHVYPAGQPGTCSIAEEPLMDASVSGPTKPVGGMSWSDWYFCTAVLVCAPKYPLRAAPDSTEGMW